MLCALSFVLIFVTFGPFISVNTNNFTECIFCPCYCCRWFTRNCCYYCYCWCCWYLLVEVRFSAFLFVRSFIFKWCPLFLLNFISRVPFTNSVSFCVWVCLCAAYAFRTFVLLFSLVVIDHCFLFFSEPVLLAAFITNARVRVCFSYSLLVSLVSCFSLLWFCIIHCIKI